MEPDQTNLKTPRRVFVLGWVSFFNDIASEMIYPIVPIFLTTVLGAPVAAVGLIEGVAEATSSFLKVASGWWSDKFNKRKPFVVVGYGLSTIAKVIFGFAFYWPTVFAARFVDRLGKGVRTSARDALIADGTHPSIRGKAFGLHRSFDTLGAILGPIIALGFLAIAGDNLRPVFFFAAIPAAIGVLILIIFVKDVPKQTTEVRKLRFKLSELNPSFKVFLLISLVFAIGNSADAFLILRAKDLGLSTTLTVLAYILYNITYAGLSLPAGMLGDRIGFRRVLAAGFLIFALVYFGFGATNSSWWIWPLFFIYGFYIAFTDGVSKAYISNIVPKEQLATSMGIYQVVTGVGILIASIVAGGLWTIVGPQATFYYGSAMAVIAIILFVILQKRIRLQPAAPAPSQIH